MLTIQFESEDFKAQELREYLQENGLLQDMEATIVSARKEGLSYFHDLLEIIIKADLPKELVVSMLSGVIGFAGRKALEFIAPNPHILVRFSNGQETKISYKGKSDKSIVKELLAYIDEGDVVRVVFKS